MFIRMAILLLFAAAMPFHGQEDETLVFVLDNMTLVTENGERIVSREDYEDVIKKDITILREYDEIRYGDIKYRVLDYGSFNVLFDEICKVRNIRIQEPGSKLLNGIGIGEPLENFLEDLQDDPRYLIRFHRKFGEKRSYLTIEFTEFEVGMLGEGTYEHTPIILINYDEERKVSYVNAGFGWP